MRIKAVPCDLIRRERELTRVTSSLNMQEKDELARHFYTVMVGGKIRIFTTDLTSIRQSYKSPKEVALKPFGEYQMLVSRGNSKAVDNILDSVEDWKP
ncbi:hypothetical protein ACLOJK_013565 [Asimina triloba]